MLRSLLTRGEFIAAPGVHDGFSALLADRFGFNSLYMSGYCVAASRHGLPDAGLVGMGDMVQTAQLLGRCSSKPLIADADTGYGGLLNVQHTVREYERAGVAAIQIEDQEMPKKCGHTKGKRVIEAAEMAAKIAVAVETRSDMLVIARTDALATHGIGEALARCRLYRRAGADLVFVDGLDSAEAIRRTGGELGADGPVMINITPAAPGFLTPQYSCRELQELGFAIAIFPGLFVFPALSAMEAAAGHFLAEGRQIVPDAPLRVPSHELVGFPAIWADEARWQAMFTDGGGAP